MDKVGVSLGGSPTLLCTVAEDILKICFCQGWCNPARCSSAMVSRWDPEKAHLNASTPLTTPMTTPRANKVLPKTPLGLRAQGFTMLV